MSKLRVGIVGAGQVAPLHALGYAQDDRAEIVAVCDMDEDRAIQAALKWGAGSFFRSFDEMLQLADVDAIEILTPNPTHAEFAIKALALGKHVSVERPMALSLQDAERVLQSASQSKRIFSVYEPCLYYKPLLDARQLLDAGEIGTVTHIGVEAVLGRSTQGVWDLTQLGPSAWRFQAEEGSPSPLLFDVAYQSLCMAMYLIGPIDKVQVWSQRTAVTSELELDAPTQAMWQHFGTAAFGAMSLTYAPERKINSAHAPMSLRLRLQGTRGELSLLHTSEVGTLEPHLEVVRGQRRMAYGQRSSVFEDSFARATRNFISACYGEEEPLLQGPEARQLLILATAFTESARRGRAITLQHG